MLYLWKVRSGVRIAASKRPGRELTPTLRTEASDELSFFATQQTAVQ